MNTLSLKKEFGKQNIVMGVLLVLSVLLIAFTILNNADNHNTQDYSVVAEVKQIETFDMNAYQMEQDMLVARKDNPLAGVVLEPIEH